MRISTQVAIIGAGPAGLLLSHLLHLQGIQSVVLENRSKDHVEHRVRAGVLEQATADLLYECGVGERMRREALVHRGIELRFGGRGHRIDLADLTGGRAITVYGQQEVVKDLIQARLAADGRIFFSVEEVSLHDIDAESPRVRCRNSGEPLELRCRFVAGCDGFHGVCRDSIPSGALRIYERNYPFAWLGVLAQCPPSSPELIYCHHERGFALFSMRSAQVSRLYIQVSSAEQISQWPDDRVWQELRTRAETSRCWKLIEGPMLEKSITPIRSFVAEPMRYGSLFLAGDAAHIVPPTGAKGLNLAVADVRLLARALAVYFTSGRQDVLDAYSATSLQRVWRAEHFSWWMTTMLHCFPGEDGFQQRLRRSQLEYVVSSRAAASSFAENYVGLPFES